jgi:lysophospholipase
MQPAPLHADIARGPEGGRAFWLTAADGVRLRLGVWPGPAGAKGTVFLLPGRTEYIEKYGPAAADLAQRGYAMLAVDWRGQGLADRLLDDPVKGHVVNFTDYQLDMAAVCQAAEALELPRPWVILGHSMGGAIGLRALMGAHPFAACAFSAPMWGIGLPALVHPFGARIARALNDTAFALRYAPGTGPQTYVFRDPFLDNKLTTDPGMWAFMVDQLAQAPALMLSGPSLRWVTEGILECAALAALPAPDLPCYTALGGLERIVDIPAVERQIARWPKARLDRIASAQHEVMMETAATRAHFYDACAALFDANRG